MTDISAIGPKELICDWHHSTSIRRGDDSRELGCVQTASFAAAPQRSAACPSRFSHQGCTAACIEQRERGTYTGKCARGHRPRRAPPTSAPSARPFVSVVEPHMKWFHHGHERVGWWREHGRGRCLCSCARLPVFHYYSVPLNLHMHYALSSARMYYHNSIAVEQCKGNVHYCVPLNLHMHYVYSHLQNCRLYVMLRTSHNCWMFVYPSVHVYCQMKCP